MGQNHMGDRRIHAAAPQQKLLRGLVSTLLVMSSKTTKE